MASMATSPIPSQHDGGLLFGSGFFSLHFMS